MRRMWSVLIVLVLLVSLAGCKSSDLGTDSGNASTSGESSLGTDSIDSVLSTSSKKSNRNTDTTDAVVSTSSKNSDRNTNSVVSTSSKTSDRDTDEPESDDYMDWEENLMTEFRGNYGWGVCSELNRKVVVLLFFMDDFESSWTQSEITSFVQNEINPAFDFLEKEAKEYGVSLDFEVVKTYSSVYYNGQVIVDPNRNGTGTGNVLWNAVQSTEKSPDWAFLPNVRNTYHAASIVSLTLFNTCGTSYAHVSESEIDRDIEEHCIIFANDLNLHGTDPVGSRASVVAHEVLHLFGAEDYYRDASRKALAEDLYPQDLMLQTPFRIDEGDVGEATAFYVGWTNEVPDVLTAQGW